jgi:hypothetical protein
MLYNASSTGPTTASTFPFEDFLGGFGPWDRPRTSLTVAWRLSQDSVAVETTEVLVFIQSCCIFFKIQL